MRISDWSSDVCSSDLKIYQAQLAFDEADEIEDFQAVGLQCREAMTSFAREIVAAGLFDDLEDPTKKGDFIAWSDHVIGARAAGGAAEYVRGYLKAIRSEEHTSELQSLMRISYAVFCLKKKTNKNKKSTNDTMNQHK